MEMNINSISWMSELMFFLRWTWVPPFPSGPQLSLWDPGYSTEDFQGSLDLYDPYWISGQLLSGSAEMLQRRGEACLWWATRMWLCGVVEWWGAELGGWLLCPHPSEATQSCSRPGPWIRKGGSWELIAITLRFSDPWFLKSCFHLLLCLLSGTASQWLGQQLGSANLASLPQGLKGSWVCGCCGDWCSLQDGRAQDIHLYSTDCASVTVPMEYW